MAMCSASRTSSKPSARKNVSWESGGIYSLGQERVDTREVLAEGLGAEGFYVEADRGIDVRKRFVVGGTLADDGALQANWIGDETILVLLDDDHFDSGLVSPASFSISRRAMRPPEPGCMAAMLLSRSIRI